MFLVTSWELPTARSGSRPSRAPWISPRPSPATSACRNRSSCRRAPWPCCGSTSSCCNSGWRRSRNWCRSPRRRKSPGSPAAATTPSRMKNPSGCSRWPKSCGGYSTTSTRAFSTSARGPCGPRANCCWNSTAISTSSSAARTCLKQEGIVFRHLLRLILLLREFRPLCSARSRSCGLALRSGRSRRSAHGKLPRGRSHQHRSRAGDRRRAGRRGGEVRRGDLRLSGLPLAT